MNCADAPLTPDPERRAPFNVRNSTLSAALAGRPHLTSISSIHRITRSLIIQCSPPRWRSRSASLAPSSLPPRQRPDNQGGQLGGRRFERGGRLRVSAPKRGTYRSQERDRAFRSLKIHRRAPLCCLVACLPAFLTHHARQTRRPQRSSRCRSSRRRGHLPCRL